MSKGQKKKPLIFVLILVGVLLVAGAVLFFVTLSNNSSDDSAASVNEPSATSEAPKATEKPKRKVYPIGKWDLPIPFMNPFGSQSNYASVEYKKNQYQDFNYVNKDNILASRVTCGEVWDMRITWKDQPVDAYEDLDLYISELGGESYQGESEDQRVVHLKDKDNVDYWGLARRDGDGYTLRVYKETVAQAGKPLTIKTADYGDVSNIYFITHHQGTKFESMTVKMTEGAFWLNGDGAYRQGEYTRAVRYQKELAAYKTKDYILDDIPQESFPVLWRIDFNKDTDPKEMTFDIQQGADITPVTYGERLGALKVHGVSFGTVTVKPAFNADVRHPDLSANYESGDITPEGDTIFWLPSGYWNLEIRPNKNESVSYCVARLIPVSESEMTVLDIPPAINDSYGNNEQGIAGGNESGIKIMEAKEQGAQATMTFQLLDSKNPKMTPTLQNSQIVEGGKEAKIVQIERLKTPPSVVLVLDSSGSMKGQMEQVVTAAKTFIQGLPDDAFVQVLDFDTKPTVLKGNTKAEVLKGLGSIKANGATCLYDSVIKGIELLKDKERPTLVVFTDGVDANANDTGPGSVATKQQAMEAVKTANVSLFTIGFGPKHDNTTLLELAGVSDGMYYPAQDKAALDKVFQAINNKLGNTFKLTYERPKEAAPADVPVISLVLDTSGSMDSDPSDERCDWRIDKVKRVYHDFINRIPDQSLVQLMRFSDDVSIEQVNTVRRPELLQALGELGANGGTEILMSVTSAYKAIKPVPSNKRIIVYMTDAALAVTDDQKAAFEVLLQEIKDKGIQILWVGLGVEKSEDAFKWAAEKSGGSYVISEDPAVIGKALDDALAKVQKLPADKLTLALNIKNDSGVGDVANYSATQLVDFPIPQSSGQKITLNTISYQTGTKVFQYEPKTAQLVYGDSIPNKEVKLSKKITLNASGSNKAMAWKAGEAYFFSMLRGIEAPNGKCFLAVEMEMKNTLTNNVPYLIPDTSSHFFVNMNNKGAYPASTATWLTETPLTPPGDSSLYMAPGQTVHGLLVFLVPDEKTEQMALHYYDTSYGHITLNAIGDPVHQDVALEALPTTATGKLSDTFEITVKSKKDLTKIENTELKEGSLFRVIEGQMNAKVQALLDINPMERFYLKIQTAAGPFMVKMNDTTALLPYGFLRPVMLAPGSSNTVRCSFQIPTSVKDAKMDLYGDIAGGAVSVP
ncbi:MAG: VWA domain-containing protein, partial [Clostridia bacterium]|nr:VWA domain-containing protein [Clostridia bacterium]